jgi:hypothetical protein
MKPTTRNFWMIMPGAFVAGVAAYTLNRNGWAFWQVIAVCFVTTLAWQFLIVRQPGGDETPRERYWLVVYTILIVSGALTLYRHAIAWWQTLMISQNDFGAGDRT